MYYTVNLSLTNPQNERLIYALNNPLKKNYLTLKPSQISNNAKQILNFNPTQRKKINKGIENNKAIRLKISNHWLNQNKNNIKKLVGGNLEKFHYDAQVKKNKINFKPLSTPVIEKLLINSSTFRGVYSRDTIPTDLTHGSGIINLETSYEGGSHWVCFYSFVDYIFYIDSYGLQPPEEFISKSTKKIKYSNSEIQTADSIMCGYYCIYCIESLDKGMTPYDFIMQYDTHPTERNETLIKIYAKNLHLRENVLIK